MKFLKFSTFCVFTLLSFSKTSFGQTLQENKTLMGKALSVTQQYGTVPSGNGVNSGTNVKFLGKSIQLLNSIVDFTPANSSTSTPPIDPLAALIGNTHHDFYVGGIKIYSETLTATNGSVVYTGTVPPGQLAVPVFAYVVGPLVLEVDAGLSYEAGIVGKLTPTLSIPLTDSSVSASIDTSAAAAGFVEGLARFLIVQAGIGGSVNILQGDANVAAQVFFQGSAPKLTYGGKLSVLSGKIFGFVDYKRLFGDWKRIYTYNFYQWPGKCWAMGATTCGNN